MAITSAVVGFSAIMFRALLPYLTRKLMRLAVSLLPENLRARYDEEWQSYIADVSDSVPKFCASFSLVFGAAVISRREKYESITKHFAAVAGEVEQSVKLVNALVRHLPALVSAFPPANSKAAALQLRILTDIETMRVESENFAKLRDRLANAAKMSPRAYLLLRSLYGKRFDNFISESKVASESAKNIKGSVIDIAARLRNHVKSISADADSQ